MSNLRRKIKQLFCWHWDNVTIYRDRFSHDCGWCGKHLMDEKR